MNHYQIVFSILWILSLFYGHGTSGKLSGRENKEELEETVFDDDSWDAVKEEGRLDMDEQATDRNALPPEIFKFNSNLDTLTCGRTYNVRSEGYLVFDFDSPTVVCTYNFIGSKTNECQVAVMCSGTGNFGKKTSKGCEGGIIIFNDAQGGKWASCGEVKFDKVPRTARNGTDLFLAFRGKSSPGASCVAFCVQDVKHQEPRLESRKILPQIKNFKGLQTETSCVCGIRQNKGRVINGENALKFEFQWMGAVVIKRKGFSRKPFCGSALINDNYVISAAHCFTKGVKPADVEIVFHAHVMDRRVKSGMDPEDPKFYIIPGWNDKAQTDDSEESVRVEVEKIVIHPLYDKNGFDYDIAILKLKSKINLRTGNVLPICLPNIQTVYDYSKEPFVVTGWGRYQEDLPAGVRILQRLDVPFESLQTCRDYSKATSRHLCAGYLEGGKDTCQGDSGGPLMFRMDTYRNQYMLAGVVSAGNGCAKENSFGLYTNVQELLQWIYSKTSGATWCKI